MATDSIGEYEFGGFRVDVAARRLLTPDGNPVDLSARAFDVLLHLLEHRGTDVSKERLMNAVWPDTVVEENNLNQAITLLRRALGDQRNAPRFIMTVPGRGYRFVAKVVARADGDTLSHVAVPAPPASPLSVPGPVPPGGRWSRSKMRAVGLIFAVGLVTAVLVVMRMHPAAGETPVDSLAVLPFRPLLVEHDNPALELGMADSLINQISALPGVTVRSLGTVANLRGAGLDPLVVGRQLGVAAVLEGTLQEQKDRIRVTARLLRVSDGRSLWSGQFDEQISGIFEVHDAISKQVMRRLATHPDDTAVPRPTTRNTEAYQLYAAGVFNFQRRDIDGTPAAVESFNAAIHADPNYAQAWAALATVRSMQSAFGILPAQIALPDAKRAAQRAIELDPAMALGQAAMGQVLVQYENRFLEGEEIYRRALELDPRLGIAHLWTSINDLYLGRIEVALTAARRAQELEPGNMPFSVNVGRVLYYSRNYDAAAAHLRRLIALVPTFDDAHTLLGRALLQQGRVEDALAQFRARNRTSPGSFGDVGRAYAAAGRAGEAQAEITKLGVLAQQGFGVSYDLAGIHALLGNAVLACNALKQARADHSQAIGLLRVDPDFDRLRDQPCYVEVERAVYGTRTL